ncbi:2-phosphosulfolactate phosphatase [Agromyces ramosus]|uniref:2-phosphosulfolactate phosphatase n=1 Tax=Agromyces ramosus TaxID=33879 RepID=A0ABU0R5C5_9MICO|nr:2-phosphosulfolactate phosphatase [Agromyces ramosus]MDQ0893282.1 2-phosphosulfolactate phosphatase [Agromyces ramosus]
MSESSEAFGQSKYQVRFDWGVRGAARIAGGADVVVWVDVIRDAAIPDAAATGLPTGLFERVPADAAVLVAGLVDATATARWILAEQERLGRRAYLAILAAGDADAGFAADDLLGAGAVIDALAALGIDDTSPEAAVAAAAFGGLRRAVRHLTSASASGRAAAAAGVGTGELHAAASLDSSGEARVVRTASQVRGASVS